MKKVSLSILLIVVILLASFTNVQAADCSATFNLTTTNTNVKVGDEVTVTFSIGSLNGFSDIKTIATKKVYDSSIFQYLGATGENGWEVKGDATNIVLRNDAGASTGTIAVLKFKVLKEVENARIQLSEMDAAGSDGDVYYSDNNVNAPYVDFKITTSQGTNNPPDDTNRPSDDTNKPTSDTDKPTQDTNKPTLKNDKTVANSKVPQTGEPYAIILTAIVAVVLAAILFAKYKSYENKMK